MIASVTSILDHSAGDAAALMQVAGVTKRYGEQRALADVSFAVNAGEVLGLIGPNGAGKTTLLEAIAGLVPADGGHVLWRGNSPPLSQRREFMFYLPDGAAPLGRRIRCTRDRVLRGRLWQAREDRAEAIGALGLAPVLRRRIGALSKGYGRRLMLALALIAPQPLLLMDEPFDGFDLRQTREIMGVVRDVARSGPHPRAGHSSIDRRRAGL